MIKGKKNLIYFIDSLTLDLDPDLDSDPDPNWAKILNPDPNSMNSDPQHCGLISGSRSPAAVVLRMCNCRFVFSKINKVLTFSKKISRFGIFKTHNL